MEKKEPKRIENLEFKRATYLLPEDEWPEHPSYHINYWYPNQYYGREDDFDKSEDGHWYLYKNPEPWQCHFRIHESCFKNPESCFAVASFDYDKHEGYYELRFVGDRPLSLTKEEREIFWELIKYGDETLNKNEEENN